MEVGWKSEVDAPQCISMEGLQLLRDVCMTRLSHVCEGTLTFNVLNYFDSKQVHTIANNSADFHCLVPLHPYIHDFDSGA